MKYKYKKSLKKIIFLFFFLLEIILNAANNEIKNSNFKYFRNSLKFGAHRLTYKYGFPIEFKTNNKCSSIFFEEVEKSVPLTDKIAIEVLALYNIKLNYSQNNDFRKKLNFFLHHKYGPEPPQSISEDIMRELELPSKNSLNILRKKNEFLENLRALEKEIENIELDEKIFKNTSGFHSINIKIKDLLTLIKLPIFIRNIDYFIEKEKNKKSLEPFNLIERNSNNSEKKTPTFPESTEKKIIPSPTTENPFSENSKRERTPTATEAISSHKSESSKKDRIKKYLENTKQYFKNTISGIFRKKSV